MNKTSTLWSCLHPDGVTFDSQKNYYQTSGSFSYAGNFYYLAFRCTNEYCVFFEIGCQNQKEYVNSIEIFRINGGHKTWIGGKNYSSKRFNDNFINSEINSIILEKAMDYCKINSIRYDIKELEVAIRSKVAKTCFNQVTAYSDLKLENQRNKLCLN